MEKTLPVFQTPAVEAQAMEAYQTVLNQWPVPYAEEYIPTCFGETHVITCGPENAPPIVLLHAFYASATAWFRVAEGLTKHFRVYAVDMIGEPNRSRSTRAIKNMDEMIQWFAETLDGLGCHQVYLVGNSFGAFFATSVAMRLPDRVQKMVLIAPAATFHEIWPFYWNCMLPKMLYMFFPKSERFKRWSLRSAEWIRAGAPSDPAWERLFALFMTYGTGARMVFPRVYSDKELAQVKTPTLLLIGDKEVIYQPEAAIRSARRKLPNIQCAILPGANHIAAISQPELVNKQIVNFFC